MSFKNGLVIDLQNAQKRQNSSKEIYPSWFSSMTLKISSISLSKPSLFRNALN
jgi:hypothetical protein